MIVTELVMHHRKKLGGQSQPRPHFWQLRWLLRLVAFSTILSYGILIVSSPMQLKHLLDAAFEIDDYENHSPYLGFIEAPYHYHLRTRHHGKSGTVASSSFSSSAIEDELLHITFQLHDPKTVPQKTDLHQNKCPLGELFHVLENGTKFPQGIIRTGELPPSLVRVHVDEQSVRFDNTTSHVGSGSGRVLDFAATISTNLKILFIGDSVMMQLSQAFDQMVMGGVNGQNHENTSGNNTRKFLWKHWVRTEDGGTIVAPTRGGGVSGSYRMTGLLSRSYNMTGILTKTKTGELIKLKRPIEFPYKYFQEEEIGMVDALKRPIVGAWKQEQIDQLLGHSYMNSSPSSGKHHNQTIGKFDVCILRVMHGWMPFEAITRERLVEAIELSGKLLGAKTFVFMTVPFTNNVRNKDNVNKMNAINNDIRQIARGWDASSTGSGVQHVLVLEYGTYYNHIIWSSGIHLGYTGLTHPLKATQKTFDAEMAFAQDRLKQRFFAPSIPMVCGDMTSVESKDRKDCNRNFLFKDGQHICPETLASRYAVGVACLLGCVYNGRTIQDAHNNAYDHDDDYDDTTNTSTSTNNRVYYDRKRINRKIRACERECNDQFLSVVPIDESWIDSNTTLASFSRGKDNEFE
eukprot:CAMPEP_0183715720 /NCGR_PEP_ID=MMETSP0737-20130205/9836_1 /TAXON_ID=385413 /ORGANISM="Thalassiosira miniscula, Strain CCMP1093" /LENGTH=630 /DNA_ID=CAMNT_0025944851 /DNA_START=119 /DNA_END=2011 /DNA_ORIENTATION=+